MASTAWSPKENRDVPPLDYPLVYRLKRERPELTVAINGGVPSLDAAQEHLAHVDGVMLGRAAYHEPAILGDADRRFFDASMPRAWIRSKRSRPIGPTSPRDAGEGVPMPHAMTRHMLGLMHGRAGARAWRRILTVETVDLQLRDRGCRPRSGGSA